MTAASTSARLYIAQGEHAVSGEADILITTILGSCVAVCLWDPKAGIGGMNHILLPEAEAAGATGVYRFGAAAMEVLINDMMKAGAQGSRLRAKMFGGAAMLGAISDVGARNVIFAGDFLRREGIPLDAASTGGVNARQIRYWPKSGRAHQRVVRSGPLEERPVAPPAANEVELF